MAAIEVRLGPSRKITGGARLGVERDSEPPAIEAFVALFMGYPRRSPRRWSRRADRGRASCRSGAPPLTENTDCAVVEECNHYSERGDFQAVCGNPVFIIEDRDQDFVTGCQKFPESSIVRRDVGVSTPNDAAYRYDGR
jgi:hypothetical protein